MCRIFISHKNDDKPIILPIVKMIEDKLGEKCWIDLNNIESDSQFADVICGAINECEVFLFMYTSRVAKTTDFQHDWMSREINYAEKRRKRIVIINVDGTSLNDHYDLLYGTKHNVDVRYPERFDKLCIDLMAWLPVSKVENQMDVLDSAANDHAENHHTGHYPEMLKYLTSIRIMSLIGVAVSIILLVVLCINIPDHVANGEKEEIEENCDSVACLVSINGESITYTWVGQLDSNNLPIGEGFAYFMPEDSLGRKEYCGKMHNGLFEDSMAILTFTNGSKYEGAFEKGQFKKGKLILPEDGLYYIGTFKDNRDYNGKWFFTETDELYSEIVNGKEIIK